jgi:hypothetical protein
MTMKTLSIVPQPAPAAAPDLDMTGTVAMTATVFPKKGTEFWVCNPMGELVAAMAGDDRFVAHKVIGMQAKRVILDPLYRLR